MAFGRFGRFALDALRERVFTDALKWAWNALGDLAKEPEIRKKAAEKIDQYIKSNGWRDENLFAEIIAHLNTNTEKKKMLSSAMTKLELMDKASGTHYARNTRLAIISYPTNNARRQNWKKGEEKTMLVHNGTLILEDILSRCNHEQELFFELVALGIMQDAPNGGFEVIVQWAKLRAWPLIHDYTASIYQDLDNLTINLETSAHNRAQRFKDLPWYKKLIRR